MTQPLGTYSFLPWLRQGLANRITSADNDPAVLVRPRITVELAVQADAVAGGTLTAPVTKTVALYGPGDIVGIDRRAIVRVEPRDWITNFEPNHLAHIEFYDEDFPWRYTPAAPDEATGRLRPWITLLVLAEDEFTEGRAVADRPLPYVDVTDLTALPPASELWAWAHVHVNRDLTAGGAEFVSRDMAAVLPRLAAVLGENPDLAYSRLVSPRQLAPDQAYHAFLIPTFETGRRAGLGLPIDGVPATMSAWDPGGRPEPASFPVYHRWFFRTGSTGDFETLVRLLKPRPVDPRVGTRNMDVQFPGSGVRGVDKPELGGVLRLGGALRPPAKVPPEPPDVFETWDDPFPRPLQQDLARLINLPETAQRAGDPDPVVAPPLYGGWHALTRRVLTDADGTPVEPAENWVHRLNLDPRFRAAAGFGTRVIQEHQEEYLDAAWAQIGDVLEARRRIRQGQFGLHTSDIWYDRHLLPTLAVSRQRALLLVAPLNRRVLTSGFTVRHIQEGALVSPPMTSTALRRITRPRGRLVRSLPFDDTRTPDQLLDRVNAGAVSAAPSKVTPPGAVSTADAARAVEPPGVPSWLLAALRRWPWLPRAVLLAAIALAVLAFLLLVLPAPVLAVLLAVLLVAAGVFAYRRLSAWLRAVTAADTVAESSWTPAWVDRLPGAAGFTISEPDDPSEPARPGPDSVEASRFKTGLREEFELVEASRVAGVVPDRATLDLGRVAADAMAAIRPSVTIPRRVLANVEIPPRISAELDEDFVEPMAYPIIDQPMYEPLRQLSDELFLPNLNLIEPNTVTLMETNQRFIEAYLVGLNHEFARELLWREYPTDQRGSTFRQFWDVRGFFNADNLDNEDLKEKLRDIPPLHTWSRRSPLGSHDHREADRTNEDELVLVIRGELLKRYPTAVIYAHRACWQRPGDGTPEDQARHPCQRAGPIDPSRERRLVPLTPAEEANPPRDKVLTPLYEAKVDPDIYFFGFDLTVRQARGGTGANPDDDPGWFFILKERPGEPRFGLDTDRQPALHVWNDLSWPDVHPAPGNLVLASAPATFTLVPPGTEDQEKAEQHTEDVKVDWSRTMSAAELAYILFQAPVLVGVHATEMLPR